MSKSALILISLIFGCNSVELPWYIKKCTFDALLPQCVLDQVSVIKPYIKDGIKEMNIPKLVPFHLESLHLPAGKDLTIKLSNVDIFDLDKFDMTNVTFDAAARNGSSSLYFENIHITGMYDMDGKILVLPIRGHGPFRLTIYQFNCQYLYDLEFYERDNTTYFHFTHGTFHFYCGKINLQLSNLFDGDKVLGDQVNAFLNQNWKEIEELLRAPISNTVQDLIADVYDAFSDNIPLGDLFDIPKQ